MLPDACFMVDGEDWDRGKTRGSPIFPSASWHREPDPCEHNDRTEYNSFPHYTNVIGN